MKIVTILGTRPEIIRLSRIIPRLDRACDHVLVNTGQNFDPALNARFFDELKVRAPDVDLAIGANDVWAQISKILSGTAEVFRREKPDRVLILGDTNSGLSALAAARLGIPVYHMEAGNRCFDDRVPEEINRRVIDHCSTVLLPYTHRSKDNLVREGFPRERIFVTGNPILEVLEAYEDRVRESKVHERLDVEPRSYLLATLHRSETVDHPDRLAQAVEGLQRAAKESGLPVVLSVHPRTADRLRQAGMDRALDDLRLVPPQGFFDFVRLQQEAACVLTDSGTVQEEACLFRVPAVTIREVTERPETVECGSNVLSGLQPERIAACLRLALESGRRWNPPPEYLEHDVSTTVTRILTGFRRDEAAPPGEAGVPGASGPRLTPRAKPPLAPRRRR